MQLSGDFQRLLAHGLAQAERHPGRRIGHIFAKNQHRIGLFDFVEGWRTGGPRLQNIDHRRNQSPLVVGNACKKAILPHQPAQREVGLKRRPRRTDADRLARDERFQFPLRFIREMGRPSQPCGADSGSLLTNS